MVVMSLQIAITGIYGSNVEGEIWIDEVQLTTGLCESPTTTTEPTTTVAFQCSFEAEAALRRLCTDFAWQKEFPDGHSNEEVWSPSEGTHFEAYDGNSYVSIHNYRGALDGVGTL